MRIIMAGLFLVAAAAAPAQAQSDPVPLPGGAFMFAAGRDALDDTDRSIVLLQAADNAQQLALGWACQKGKLQVWLIHPYMGGDSNDKTRVRYRFDAEPASEIENWSVGSQHKVSTPQGKRNEQFTAQARGHRQVVVRITDPLDSATETGTFPLEGIGAALSRLSCVR